MKLNNIKQLSKKCKPAVALVYAKAADVAKKAMAWRGKTAIILIIMAGLLLSYFLVARKNISKNTTDMATVATQDKTPPKFSRITFFHSAKPICTLAIPENWEGKYRLQDGNGLARFLYIQDASNPELFYVKKYKTGEVGNKLPLPAGEGRGEGGVKPNERKIGDTKDSFYVAGLSTQIVNKPVQKKEFEKMTKDLDELLKSFKCF